jgi:hypothetical protein
VTNPTDGLPRYWRWLVYLIVVAIVVTVIASIVQIIGGIFGWS